MANDFDEASWRVAFDKWSKLKRDPISLDQEFELACEHWARWQHSLMQERLAEALERIKLQDGILGSLSLEEHRKLLATNAQLSATCERYRNALEQCYNLQDTDYVETTDEHGDEKELWVNSNELRHICEEALESGERSGD